MRAPRLVPLTATVGVVMADTKFVAAPVPATVNVNFTSEPLAMTAALHAAGGTNAS
jgi:hypothetical protein